jgi:glycosyltransferase involved in cell wall biosynthesis
MRLGTQGSVIAFLPVIRTESEVEAVLARVGWYLYPYRSQIDAILLPTTFELPKLVSVPEEYDPVINQRLVELFPCCQSMQPGTSADELESDLARRADVVLVWRWPELESERSKLDRVLSGIKPESRWYDVDATKSRAEGSYFLWLGSQCFPDSGLAVERSRSTFNRFAKTVKSKKAYVFGTGPSLDTVLDHDFSDGDVYAANSIIKNRELLRRIRPKALVAADPIFHSGCSAYAAEFRRQLVEVLDEFDFFFFVPERDYHIYTSCLPQRHHDCLLCIPFNDNAPYNIALDTAFYVNGTGNILTLFLLPLAASFHEEVHVVACDGRPRSENQYFWSHDPSAQFGSLMQSAKAVHPAFFAIDYDDYYDEHLRTLENAVNVIERAGKKVSSLTPSHIPILAARFSGQLTSVGFSVVGETSESTHVEVVGLAPDAASEVGHYLGYEEHLLSAFSRAGIPYLTLCNKNIPDAAIKDRKTFYPALTVHTWDIGNNWEEPPRERVLLFLDEVRAGLDTLAAARGNAKRIVYLYYGSLYHVEAMASLVQERPDISATVNLFWTCNDPIWSDEFGARWKNLRHALSKNLRLNVTVSTVELQSELQTRLGIRFPLAPHPSPTFSDENYLKLRVAPQRRRGEPLSVVFPGLLRYDKGFHLAADAARQLSSDSAFQCSLRSLSFEDTPNELVELVMTLRSQARLIEGELDRSGFIDFLKNGDLAVIPYSVKAFARRTSGLMVDALYCGLPIVAIRGSWLGNRIEQSGAGVVVDGEDSAAIASAVREISADFTSFRNKAVSAGAEWFQQNSWAALAASVLAVNR